MVRNKININITMIVLFIDVIMSFFFASFSLWLIYVKLYQTAAMSMIMCVVLTNAVMRGMLELKIDRVLDIMNNFGEK